ncbi:MAG: calcium-binding protein [Chloroflexi bacterium]|nr:calcium-binding protein [Chloroflexota bacterium]
MTRIERDEERENRIQDEVIVDAYDPEEQAMGWYYYLAETMTFTFQAKCIQELRKSPLKLGEIITVADMISEDDSYEMLAEVEFMGRQMGVPLHQLEPIDVDENTRQGIEDWQYWIGRGYEFG